MAPPLDRVRLAKAAELDDAAVLDDAAELAGIAKRNEGDGLSPARQQPQLYNNRQVR